MNTLKFNGLLINLLPQGSFVLQLLDNIMSIMDEVHYFPEYTLHDEHHINEVLRFAYELIGENTIKNLKKEAIEILVSAIAIHDLGMFIMQDGLKKILFGEYKNYKTEYLDENTWFELWQDFYRKAQRWDGRKLHEIFGNDNDESRIPIKKNKCVEEGLNKLFPDDDTINQRLLYGEFIRENHTRLAFDITQFGFPGANDIDIFKDCKCNKNTRDMIGIVARSHGYDNLRNRNLRDYLDNHPHDPKNNGIPIYYLMTVLCIADYIHIGRDRANETRRDKNDLKSVKSNSEFDLNQAVLYGPKFNIEEKSIYIELDNNIMKSSIFLNFKETLRNIQSQLDMCWAVLAEEYKYEYGLSIHRIKSNIYDEKKLQMFSKKFITTKTMLDANPDMIKLLIDPLYNSNVSYGVRELIQNAVDACNEHILLDKNIIGEININVDTNKRIFEITDNGIGMNEDILRNYYLVAGASFRNSEIWREKYIDDDGKEIIIRSGYFGIGALASFLLGDEITIITRYKDDKLGFHFKFSKEPKILNVVCIDTEDFIGTKIIIQMHERAFLYFSKKDENRYSWYNWHHWYNFSTPIINYRFNGKSINSKSIFNKNIEWYDVPTNDFSDMKLAFFYNHNELQIPEKLFLINGIFINEVKIRIYFFIYEYGFKTPLPQGISVVDKNKIFNLNLSRTEINNVPENIYKFICEETFKYYLAKLLTIDEESDIEGFIYRKYFYGRYFIINEKGYTICSPSFIIHTKQKKVFLFYTNMPLGINTDKIKTPIAIIKTEDSNHGFEFAIDGDIIIEIDHDDNDNEVYLEKIAKSCKYFWAAGYSDKLKIPSNLIKNIDEDRLFDVENVIEYIPENPCNIKNENLMLKVLREYIPEDINDGWIPFKLEDRKRLYKKAFLELNYYMH